MKPSRLAHLANVTLAVALMSFPAQAQPDQDPAGRGPEQPRIERGRGHGAWEERLGLNQEQETRLRDLKFKSRRAAIEAGANLRTHRLELEQLLQSDTPDRDAIDRKIGEISAVRSALMKNSIEHRIAFREVLTPDQLKTLSALRAGKKHRGFERRMDRRPHWRSSGLERP